MSKPVSGLNVFQNQAGPIPLSQLDANFNLQSAALNDTATYSNYFADSSGAPNVITVTVSAPLTFAYVTGIALQVKLANTTTSTTVNINVNALGNKPVLFNDGTAPPVGSLTAGSILDLMYDGTNFLVISMRGTTSITTGLFGNGTVAAPSVAAAADTNTGAYWPAADNFAIATGGVQRSVVGASGNWTFNTPTSGTALTVNGVSGGTVLSLQDGTVNALVTTAGPSLQIGTVSAHNFSFYTNNTTRVIVTSGGQLEVSNGSSAAPAISGINDSTTGFHWATGTSSQIGIGLGGSSAGIIAQGSFTCTFANLVGTPTGTALYQRVGNHVLLYIPSVTANSVGTSQTITGVPAVIQTARGFQVALPTEPFELASSNNFEVRLTAASGTLTFLKNGSTTGFSNGVSGYFTDPFVFAYFTG